MVKGKPGETMKELEHRFTGATKAVAFQVLKDSGPEGMTLAEIVLLITKSGSSGLEHANNRRRRSTFA